MGCNEPGPAPLPSQPASLHPTDQQPPAPETPCGWAWRERPPAAPGLCNGARMASCYPCTRPLTGFIPRLIFKQRLPLGKDRGLGTAQDGTPHVLKGLQGQQEPAGCRPQMKRE